MAIVQISKIINKQGDLADLPQLDAAEIGYATDAKRLFIGDELPPTPNSAILYNSEILTQNSVDGTSLIYDSVTGLISTTGGPTSLTVENFSGNGSTTIFNLSTVPGLETNTQIYINGVYQQKNTYTVIGNTITFSEAPLSGTDNIEVVIIQASPARYIRSSMIDYSSGTANAILYLNSNKVSTTSSALTFNGSNLGLGTASPQHTIDIRTGTSNSLRVGSSASTSGALLSWDNTSSEVRLWSLGSNPLILGTNGAENLKLDIAGNIGLGVTPSAWSVNWKTLQIGQGYSSIVGRSDALALYIGQNWRYNGADRYIANGYATTYTQQSGQHIWTSAPSGTAGTVASFTQVMTLDASGNLGIGTGASSLTRRLEVNGSIRLSNASRVEWGGANYWIDANASGSMTFGLAGNEVARYSTRALGIGIVPSSWDSNYRALQIGPEGSLNADVIGAGISMSHNVYYDSGQKYIQNDWASMYTQSFGRHRWYSAGIGIPGNAVSFTEVMTITNGGNVGIGTSSPTTKLEVQGTLLLGRQNNSSEGAEIQLSRSADNAVAWAIDVYGASALNAGSLRFIDTIAGIQRLQINETGQLGLSAPPSSWSSSYRALQYNNGSWWAGTALDVGLSSNAFFDGTNWKYVSSNTAGQYFISGNQHGWYGAVSGSAGNTVSFGLQMMIDSNGRLGVGSGTISPYQVTVGAGNNNGVISVCSGTGIQYTALGSSAQYYIQAGSIDTKVGNSTNHPLKFITNGFERLRIENDGAVKISPNGPITLGSLDALQVYINTVNGRAANLASVTTGYETLAVWNQDYVGDNKWISFYENSPGVLRGTINYNRAAGTITYGNSSDYRAKDIIGDYTDSGTIIDGLKVYLGLMKGATIERPMMIAHELQEYAPYAVTGEKDAVNEDGTPKFQQVDHSVLIPLLVAEIKSLRERLSKIEKSRNK